jgi:hypothetical protein
MLLHTLKLSWKQLSRKVQPLWWLIVEGLSLRKLLQCFSQVLILPETVSNVTLCEVRTANEIIDLSGELSILS